MSGSKKFSLILMYDDGQTQRFRMRIWVLRAGLALLIVSPVLCGLGIWAGWDAWRTMSAWNQERTRYQVQIDKLQVRLERLAALEGLRSPDDAKAKETPSDSSQSSTQPSAQNVASTGEAAKTSADRTESGQEPAGEEGAASVMATTSGSKELSADDPEARAALNLGIVRVENIQPRMLDQQRIRITLDLFNANPDGSQLSGDTAFTLLTADGQAYALEVDETAFRIARFKKVLVSVLLSEELTLENSAIMVEALVDGKLVYRSITPVESQ